MNIEKVTDRDLKNCEKVYKFVHQYSNSYKISNNADKDEIKNLAITTLNNNRDLITPELHSKIDLPKIITGIPSDITDEDMETIYNYFLNTYCTEDVIIAKYIKKANDLLYEYVREVDYNINYTYLYMYFRNKDLNRVRYSCYPTGFPALLVKYMNEFAMQYDSYDWRKFYFNDFVITNIITCFMWDNDNYKGNLIPKCVDLFHNDLPYLANDNSALKSFKSEEELKEVYSRPITIRRETDSQTLDNKKDNEFFNKLMEVLDNYYITKFYNNILITSNYRRPNPVPTDNNFMKIIFNKYRNFIGDMDKIVDMFKDDEESKKLFKLLLNNAMHIDEMPTALKICTDFRKYIMEKYKNKHSLSYDEIKEYLL